VLLVVNEVDTEPEKREDMPKTSYSKPSIGATGETGSWRTFEPEIDYDYCKGCGICAEVCPKGCIEMVRVGMRTDTAEEAKT